jgi:hypothetical protein
VKAPDINAEFGEPAQHPIHIELDPYWKSGLEIVRILTPTSNAISGGQSVRGYSI